jgi:hypothetical protein
MNVPSKTVTGADGALGVFAARTEIAVEVGP